MPMYVYEAKEPEKGCAKCAKGFEIMQSINDPKLEKCPDCGSEFYQDAVIAFPNCHTLCDKLSGSHYSTLIKVENEDVGWQGGRFTVGFWYNIAQREK